MVRVRVRQHVNPLSHRFSHPAALPDWGLVYGNPLQPFHLDIGSARGKFLLQMAAQFPEINFLGTEIREPLVREANGQRDELGLKNLHFLFCNINTSIEPLLASLPPAPLRWVSIQFPDPWFKRHHLKRRVVQPLLVEAIASHLSPGGIIFLQSDIEAVALEMLKRFRAHPAFLQQGETTWLRENMFPVPTEREIATLRQNKPVYRAVLLKK